LLSFAMGVSAFAQSAEEFFKLGCNAYNSADYPKAKEYFEASLKADASPHTLYNLASTCSRLGEIGYARLYYMRAIFMQPRFPEARMGLEILLSENSLQGVASNFATNALDELSESEWTWGAFLAFWAAALAIILPLLYKKTSLATLFVALIFAAAFCVCLYGVTFWKNFAACAIAVKPDAFLKLSPAADAPQAAVLSEGQLALIEKRRGKYLYVAAPNGKEGWADAASLAPVRPQ